MKYETIQPDGKKVWLLTNVFIFVERNEHLKAYLYLLDIDRETKRELELEYHAEMDLMTGLYNKSVTNQRIMNMIDTPLPYDQRVFLIADIDCFKCINDTYGHAVGDEMIKQIAQILKTVFDMVHAIQLPDTQLRNEENSFSISMDAAKRNNERFAELFRKADKALYIGKQEYHKTAILFIKTKRCRIDQNYFCMITVPAMHVKYLCPVSWQNSHLCLSESIFFMINRIPK